LQVKIPLIEGDIKKIKVGQDATIDIAAIKERKFEGNVIRVDEYGTDTSGVITYNVYVKINNPDPAIKPSMKFVDTRWENLRRSFTNIGCTTTKLYLPSKL